MAPPVLLTLYCLAIIAVSLIGGWLPMVVTLTHRRLELALSFVSGVMLGIALLHMLPHALMQFAADDHVAGHGGITVMWWLLGGFLAIFLLERFFPFHHHEPPPQTDARHSHSHNHSHTHDHDHGQDPHAPVGGATRLHWPAALFGFAVHSVIAGMALGASVRVESGDGIALAGLGVFLVIALHKPFDSLAIGTLMAAGRARHLNRHIANTLFGLMVPLGVLLYALLEQTAVPAGDLLGAVLALSTGVFLCIALSDVLPELQFHRHDRVKLSVALLLGLALAGAVAHFEARAHQHSHAPAPAQNHDHDH